MRTKIAKWLVAISLVVVIGGHWAFLQSVAWFGMAVSYSQDAPLSVALEKTFGGKHPCSLCKFVQEGKESEKKQDLLKVETKFDFWFLQAASLLFPPAPFVVVPSGPDSARLRSEAPPTPPPRLA